MVVQLDFLVGPPLIKSGYYKYGSYKLLLSFLHSLSILQKIQLHTCWYKIHVQQRYTLYKKLDQNLTFLGMVFQTRRAARAAQLIRQSALRAHARAAQLAGGLLGLKDHNYECQNLFKSTLHCFLCKNLQLLLMQHHLTSILNPPYCISLQRKKMLIPFSENGVV